MEFETVTKHCPLCDKEVEMPADLLGGMAAAPRQLARSFKEPRRMNGEGWTPHEIVAHMADVEVMLAWRIRSVLAEDAPVLQPMDEELWGTTLYYRERELATSLATFAANRQANLELLRFAGDAGLDRPYSHPEFGSRPLRSLVEHIADHDIEHLKQIRGD
jgi:hypothetical protein